MQLLFSQFTAELLNKELLEQMHPVLLQITWDISIQFGSD